MVTKLLIALLLIASPCFADTQQVRQVVGMAIAAGGPTYLVDQSVADSAVAIDAYDMAQTFTLSADTVETTITISIDVGAEAPTSPILRIGTSNNLTTYIDEQTPTLVPGWNDITFNTGTLTAGTYCFGMRASTAGDPTLYRADTNVYAGGVYYYQPSSEDDWNISQTASRDWTFRVRQP